MFPDVEEPSEYLSSSMKNAVSIRLLILVLGAVLFGCSNNSVEPEPEDPISGTYFLHGTKVQLIYRFPWPSWGGEIVILDRDTTQVTMTVRVDLLQEKQDSVRFTGLEGVNAGEYQSINRNCTHPSCYGDAKLINGELSFDLHAPYGFYIGGGFLEQETLILQTHFEYRQVGIDYDLQGVRIDE